MDCFRCRNRGKKVEMECTGCSTYVCPPCGRTVTLGRLYDNKPEGPEDYLVDCRERSTIYFPFVVWASVCRKMGCAGRCAAYAKRTAAEQQARTAPPVDLPF